MNIFSKFYHYLQLREAVKQADKAHLLNGQRFYVMPAQDGKLIVIDRRNFRALKSKHYINRDTNLHDMLSECFYFTPHRNGDGYILPTTRRQKVIQYFQWVEAMKQLKKKKGSTQ